MKKLTFLLALMMITTFAMAQRGQNGYHGQRGQNGFHGQQGQRHTQVYRGQNYGSQYRGEVRYNRGQRGVNQGWNQRQVRVHNNGWNNGWNQTWTNGQRRTRWEYSNCGNFRYRIIERYDCRPGRWVYRNGCRRWIEPTSTWVCVSRRRFNNGCGW